MNNKQLEYAVALAESLNFTKVANSFGISQPALSKQIHNLEKELGVELFDRSRNPVSLTAAGEYFLCEAKELMYREEQLYVSMNEFKEGKRGRLTIGVSPFRALYMMPGVCKRIREKFPDVQIALCEEASDKLRIKTMEGKYDFAIVNLPVDESALNTVYIQEDKLVLVVPEAMLDLIDGPKKQMSEIDFKSCKNLPFVAVRKKQEMRILFDRICNDAGIKPAIAVEVVGLATAWAMANVGAGATILPLQFVENMPENNSLRLFIPKCEANVRRPVVITRNGRYLSEYAKYAIELLSENHKKSLS